MREFLIVLAAAALMAAGLLVWQRVGAVPPAPPADTPLLAVLGDATLVDAQGQQHTVGVSGLAERDWILLYVSASWCGPCQVFSPELIAFHQAEQQRRNLDVVLLSWDEPEEALAYLLKARMPWRMIAKGDPAEDRLAAAYPVDGIPVLLVFDRQGALRIDGRRRDPRAVLREFATLTP